MKKQLVLLGLSALLLSCTDNADGVLKDSDESGYNTIVTRSIVTSDHPSVSNPELLTNWENLQEVVLNSTTSISSRVGLPWTEGVQTAMSPTFSKDIKKEDGWVMLFHTLESRGLDAGLNYMCFYNELRGILKVFYFKEEIPPLNNGFMWLFKTQTGAKTSLFINDAYYSDPMDSSSKLSEIYISNFAGHPVDGLMAGWNGFQMEVPYSTDYANTEFLITALNKKLTTYKFEGETESITTGTIVQTSNPSPNVAVPGMFVNMAGDAAKKGVDKIVKSSRFGENSKIIKSVKNAILNIAAGGYAGAIKAGLNLLSGSVFGFSSQSTIQEVNLRTEGTISMDGSSVEESTGAIRNVGNINLYKCYNQQFLGLWNVETIPQLQYERYTMFIPDPSTEYNQSASYEYVSDALVMLPNIRPKNLYIKINPVIEKYVVNKHVTTTVYFHKGYKIKQQIPNDDLDIIPGGYTWGSYNLGYYNVKTSGTMKRGATNYYDWGPANRITDSFGINITLELTFNYKGKTQTVISSRNYTTTLIEDSSYSYVPTDENSYIVSDCRL